MELPRIEFVHWNYNPRKWSVIKIYPTDNVLEWRDNFQHFGCNGIVKDLNICDKCKLRFQCLTGREAFIIDKKFLTKLNQTPSYSWYNFPSPRKQEVLKYMFGG